jgi:hypothetical protein
VQVRVLDDEERVGEHAGGDGVMPGGPGPHLVLIESNEVLALLIVLLSVPPVMYLNRVIPSHLR